MVAENSIKEIDSFFLKFGDILGKRCADNLEPGIETDFVDKAAQDFARYLRAARLNSELSRLELAQKANLDEAELVALEQGLILSTDIKSRSLYALAEALGVDIEDFALMLERKIPKPDLTGIPAQLCNASNETKAYFGSRQKTSLVVILFLLGMAGSAIFALRGLDQPNKLKVENLPNASTSNHRYAWTAWEPYDELRSRTLFESSELNYGHSASVTQIIGAHQIQVVWIITLLFLLIWVIIAQEHLPSKIIRGMYRWEQRLVYVTPITLLCIIVMVGTSLPWRRCIQSALITETCSLALGDGVERGIYILYRDEPNTEISLPTKRGIGFSRGSGVALNYQGWISREGVPAQLWGMSSAEGPLLNERAVPNNYINAITIDRYDRLWFGSDFGGISFYTRGSSKPFETTLSSTSASTADWAYRGFSSLSFRYLPSYYTDDQELLISNNSPKLRLWIGRNRLAGDRGPITSTAFNPEGTTYTIATDLLHNDINDIAIDGADQVWIVTNREVSKIRASGYTTAYVYDDSGRLIETNYGNQNRTVNDTLTIASDGSGNIWVVTKNDGVDDISKWSTHAWDPEFFSHINTTAYHYDAWGLQLPDHRAYNTTPFVAINGTPVEHVDDIAIDGLHYFQVGVHAGLSVPNAQTNHSYTNDIILKLSTQASRYIDNKAYHLAPGFATGYFAGFNGEGKDDLLIYNQLSTPSTHTPLPTHTPPISPTEGVLNILRGDSERLRKVLSLAYPVLTLLLFSTIISVVRRKGRIKLALQRLDRKSP